ncbi:CLUMA_CG009255, isoform A [Clunio marinus]|uniref:CLUMA_CG009255, isoform A n=1 Tax=Clunio marinus TaxID=568069 RepID=A0A1J1I646_9DIPT|nr:CLUMA_CG009255, isoform A [Clunio marinus]
MNEWFSFKIPASFRMQKSASIQHQKSAKCLCCPDACRVMLLVSNNVQCKSHLNIHTQCKFSHKIEINITEFRLPLAQVLLTLIAFLLVSTMMILTNFGFQQFLVTFKMSKIIDSLTGIISKRII